MIVYLIQNLVNGKKYVGQTINSLNARWAQHILRAQTQNHAISSAIRKYGRAAFELSVLAETDGIAELNRLEIRHIAEQNSLAPFGYNLTTGGENYVRADSTKQKLSRVLQGNTHSRVIDITDQRFGRLAARGDLGAPKSGGHSHVWICECDCGNITSVSSWNLRSNHAKSCGCLQKEKIAQIGRESGGRPRREIRTRPT